MTSLICVTSFIVWLAVAAATMAGKYGIQAWNYFKTRPSRPRSRRFYEGCTVASPENIIFKILKF